MKKSILLALLLSIWVVAPVRAVEPGAASPKSQNRVGITGLQCERVGVKITQRVNLVEAARDRHYTAYQNIRKHIDQFLKRAKSRGCDAAVLTSQLDKYDDLVAAFAAAFRDWKTSLQAANDLRCAKGTELTAAIQTSQTKFAAFKSAAEAVRTYVQSTIKPSFITTLQSCKPSPKPSASPAASSLKKGNK